MNRTTLLTALLIGFGVVSVQPAMAETNDSIQKGGKKKDGKGKKGEEDEEDFHKSPPAF
jgi:hypothetical protein